MLMLRGAFVAHPAVERFDIAVAPGLAAAIPGSEVSPGNLLECGLLQLRVGQQPLERGVLRSRSLSRLASLAFIPPNWLRHRSLARRPAAHGRRQRRPLPSFSIRSAVASLRTTCSGVCFFLVAMLMSSLPAHNVGRKTLKRPGSTSRGQATTSVSPSNVSGQSHINETKHRLRCLISMRPSCLTSVRFLSRMSETPHLPLKLRHHP
jgi:hypothetical protein